MVGWLHCGTPAPRTTLVSPTTRAAVDRADDLHAKRQYLKADAAYAHAVTTARDRASRAFAGRAHASARAFWGQHRGAAEALEAALAPSEREARDWHNLGIYRHLDGDDGAAETALRRSLELAPDDPRPRVALAALLVRSRRHREAAAQYRALLKLDIPDRLRRKIREVLPRLEDRAVAPGGRDSG